ncbi:MAG: hypothetical protein K0R94_815 [Burkholderiales bacterium]|jgi:uroporphyrinogen-III synthase|nr:hypothetical protein [Burkholderiales bacterium]
MYLIVSGEKTNNYFKKALSKINIDAAAASCVQFYPKPEAIHNLKLQINNFDIIIITSPMTIYYTRELFKNLNKNVIFIVPGVSSCLKLRQYTRNRIYTPKQDSGAQAIIDEVLNCMNLNQKKVALLHGQDRSYHIPEYLNAKFGINAYTQIVIYEQKWLVLNEAYMKKFLIKSHLQGIILTSSMHAQYLFDQAQKFGYCDILKTANFITLHPKIVQVLQSLDVKGNIYVSNMATKRSLIDFIGKMHDRRNTNSHKS